MESVEGERRKERIGDILREERLGRIAKDRNEKKKASKADTPGQ